MAKLKAGFIGFIPFGTQGDDYYKTLAEYAAIGYKGTEHGAFLFNGDVDANLARIKEIGIEPIVMGMGGGRPGTPAPTMEEVAEKCHKIGVKRVATYTSAMAMFRFAAHMFPGPLTYDEVMKDIEQMEEKATFFAKEGIDYMFHNHDTEISCYFGGMNILQLMYANTENLKFELDVGWVLAGGGDPVKYVNKYADRISALHIKDLRTDGWVYNARPGQPAPKYKSMMPRFTAPGTGDLPLREVLKAGVEHNIEWAIVEQDFMYHLTQKETLACAYYNMKETGYVE